MPDSKEKAKETSVNPSFPVCKMLRHSKQIKTLSHCIYPLKADRSSVHYNTIIVSEGEQGNLLLGWNLLLFDSFLK